MRPILIVDDEPALLDAIATLLMEEGYPVRTAPNARLALEMIATEPPELLITDVMMPRLDSVSVICRSRSWGMMWAVTPRAPCLADRAIPHWSGHRRWGPARR